MNVMHLNFKHILFAVSSALFFSFPCTNAQSNQPVSNTLKISYQMRPRLEFRDGAFTPIAKNIRPAALVTQRDRLKIDYSYQDILSVRIAPQVVSIWGQANMVQGAEMNGNQISMFESWANLKLAENWNIQFGRQVISLDDERFFGELDWAQGGRAHDAFGIFYKNDKLEAKGYFAFNQNYKALYGNNLSNPVGNFYNTTDAFPYKTMQTLWAGLPINETIKITALATNLGFQNVIIGLPASKTKFMQTFGLNFFEKGKTLSFTASAYFQTGDKLSAYLGSVSADYLLNNHWKLGLGSDYLSGNDVGYTNTENHAFNPLFNTGHKFYGFIDYFYAGNPHGGAGLSDNYARLNYKSDKGFSFDLALHQFFTPNKVRVLLEEYEANLGQELDITLSYKINDFVNLIGGYSLLLNTNTLNVLKSAPNARGYQQWGWMSLNINPTLFKTNFNSNK